MSTSTSTNGTDHAGLRERIATLRAEHEKDTTPARFVDRLLHAGWDGLVTDDESYLLMWQAVRDAWDEHDARTGQGSTNTQARDTRAAASER
jgi:hypothetical protein